MKAIVLVLFLSSTCFLAADCGCNKKPAPNAAPKRESTAPAVKVKAPQNVRRVYR